MQNLYPNNSLIICPNSKKIEILSSLNQDNNLHNLKFMTKEEFKQNYLFSYDDKTLYYLVKKYHYNLNVAKIYLESLYPIDENKSYKSSKLNFLKDLKQELLNQNLLYFNPYFKNYISTKNIIVKGYYNLEKYEEEMLNYSFSLPKSTISSSITECQTMEDEINNVCLQIISLLNKGIDINNIYLTNITEEYLYSLKKIFAYYKIPLNIDMKNSIYATKVVKDYLQTKELDLSNPSKSLINHKLINILADLSFIDPETFEYDLFLIDKLKNTYFPPDTKTNAVSIKDLYQTTFSDDDYVFVLGINQDILPKTEKDLNYLDDSLKDEISLYKTTYLNKRNKDLVIYLLSNIKNIYLSYKLSSPFTTYYKSPLIKELNLKIEKPLLDSFTNSNIYNQIRLGQYLDTFYLYGEKMPSLEKLLSTYHINYQEYSNAFTGINLDTYQKNLPYPLNLSYTTLNTYNECKFKYYLKNVLKLEPFKDLFSSFVGSLYHKILSLSKNPDFDFEKEYQNYLSTRDLSLKEKLLSVRIKKDLIDLLEIIKKQELLTGYDSYYFEKKAEVSLSKDISVKFIGYIDKIMFYKKMDDTYFSIIDYKSGTIDTHIEPMKYGLHLQLPIYLYLLHYSKVFSNPIFTGIYYQNILFDYPTWTPKLDLNKNKRYLLQGYSTDNIELLERFDSTYQDSELIKSMAYDSTKGFSRFSKIIDNDTLYNLVKYTKNHIETKTDEILNADFSINPKIYNKTNVSCQYCTFKDICYMQESNLTYLDKVADLSFLGGEE